MMKRFLLLTCFCLSYDLITIPTPSKSALSKKGKKILKEQQKCEIKQEQQDWQQRNLPFIDIDTHKPFNSFGLVILTILCGPVIMIQPISRAEVSIEDEGIFYLAQDLLKYHQLPKQDKIKRTKMQSSKKVY